MAWIKTICIVVMTAVAVTGSLQPTQATWPYLQVYPPVNETDERTPLYFALMMSFGGAYTTVGAVPAVQIALDYINSHPSILPEYTLHYTLTDSLCSRSTTLRSFFSQINSEPTKVGWVGSGCSVATEPTAELTQFYNITQLSCVSSSSELSNRRRFRYYFQLLADEVGMARGFLGIIRRFGWKRVGIITQNENLFTVTMDALKRKLTEYDIDYVERVFASSEGISALQPNPFVPNTRIFVFAMYSPHARALICEAYKHGVMYPQYQLLVYGWYSDGWWRETDPDRDLGCSQEEMNTALQHALAPIQAEFYTNKSLPTEGGWTAAEYEALYWSKVQSVDNEVINLTRILTPNSSLFAYAQHCHEATIALAIALNETNQELRTNMTLNAEAALSSGSPQPFKLDHLSYTDSVVVKRMFQHLNEIDFLGISGNPVKFDRNGIREINSLTVYYYKAGPNVVEVGEVTDIIDPENDVLFYFKNSSTENEMWPSGIPNDGIPIEEVVTVSVGLTVVYVILATAGFVFAVVCLLFNFIYRHRKLIRLSSPNLNYITGLGAIILYLNAIVIVIPTTDEDCAIILCSLSPWLTAIGYSLCYGTILTKMTRVWYIFNHNPATTNKHTIHDWMLALAVLILVIFDVVIIGTYMIIEIARENLMVDKVLNREHPEEVTGETAQPYQFYIYICHTKDRAFLFAILYGYKAVLQVIALLFAFRTRKVKVKGLNDSKYIAAAIYITSIVLAVIIISTYTLQDYANTFPALVGLGLIVGTTMILTLLFVPRMVSLYKDPQGKKVFATTMSTQGGRRVSYVMGDDLETLKRRIKELEAMEKRAHLQHKDSSLVEVVVNGDGRVHFSSTESSQP